MNFPGILIRNEYSCPGSGLSFHYSKAENFEKICDLFAVFCEKIPFAQTNKFAKFYLADSIFKYKIFSYFSSANSYPNFISRYVILSPADFEKKEFKGKDLNYDFDEEILKSLIYSCLLFEKTSIEFLSIARWKVIGYSKYALSNPQKFSDLDVCENKGGEGYKEYENMFVTRYLFEEMKYNPLAFFNDNISYEVYLKEAKLRYCR